MPLTMGLMFLALFTLGAGVAARLTRNPKLPLWLSDGFVTLWYLPLLTGLAALGIGQVCYGLWALGWGHQPLLTQDTLYAVPLTAMLLFSLCSRRGRRIIFGPPEVDTSSAKTANVVTLDTASSAPAHSASDSFRPAA